MPTGPLILIQKRAKALNIHPPIPNIPLQFHNKISPVRPTCAEHVLNLNLLELFRLRPCGLTAWAAFSFAVCSDDTWATYMY